MKDTIRFMHAADFHLGAEISFLQGSKKAERKAEMIISAERIFSAAKQAQVDIVLLSGDIFDNNSADEQTVSAFFGWVNRLGDIPVILAAGNHDPLTSDSPYLKYSRPANLYVLGTDDECIPLTDLGIRVYGKSFKSVYMAGEARFSLFPEDDGAINLMVLHGELGYDLTGDYNTVTKEFIENSGMDYIALGHVHTFSALKKAGSTYYAYCGCPEPHGFDETGEKGVIFGEISKKECTVKFLPTALRRHCLAEIDVSAAKNSTDAAEIVLNDLKSGFGDNFGRNLYKVILCGAVSEGISLNTSEILKRIENEIFYIKISNRTEIEIDLELTARESSLKGMFVRRMLQKIETDGDETGELRRALSLGLKAFNSEVDYSEAE